MQVAPPDTSSILDTLSAVADTVRTAVDSLVAPADTSLFSDTTGLGLLGREVSEASKLLKGGDAEGAASLLLSSVSSFLIHDVLPALAVGFAYWVLYRLLKGFLSRTIFRTSRIDAGVEQLTLRALRVVIAAFGAVAVLSQLGIEIAPILAGLGIAGIAIAFAARDTLENLIAGVTILLDRPFRVGDYVEFDETFGSVDEITLRTTRIRTLENKMAIVPNAQVIANKILNHSALGLLRISVPFGIAYKESTEEARRIVLGLVKEDDRLHPDMAPNVVVTELADSSVNMELRLFLKDASAELPVEFDYRERVLKALKDANIEIPFPHLQLHIDGANAFDGAALMPPRNG